MQLVWIDVPGGGFAATVNLSVASLDPNVMPARLEGRFLTYGVCGEDGERIVHAERRNDGSDPIMYFNTRRDAYGFTMDSQDSDEFHAESVAATAKAARVGDSQ